VRRCCRAPESPPRTPWGHPDFRGTWTNATLTPLQRAVELGNKEFYTPEEREAFAQARRAATSADRPLGPGDVVERFARLGRDTSEDPTVFASPWSVEIPFTPSSGPLFEVACYEGNRGLANILSGARADDRAPIGRR
jgi:hypothetical protein